MALTIQVRSDDADVPKVTLDAPRIVLGRGQSCDLRLPDPSVSRRHASLRQRGSEYVLLDEGSANGTFVGETRLSPGAPHPIRESCTVRCGLVLLDLTVESAPVSPNPQQLTREIALRLIEGALTSEGRSTVPRLVAHYTSGESEEFTLRELDFAYVLGRGPQSHFDLSDDSISRQHLELTRRKADVYIRDLGAKNAMRLGTAKVPTDTSMRWPPRTAIHLSGTISLELIDPLLDALLEIEAAADEVAPSRPQSHKPGFGPGQAADDEGDDADVAGLDPQPLHTLNSAGNTRPTLLSKTRRGWTPADAAVGILALLILASSLAGIYWLIRG